jgi:hypothetical protein
MNMPPEQKKIRSVLELARYQVGDVAWWVILRPSKPPADLAQEDQWMEKHHPKVLYKGPYKDLWPRNTVLPRLQHMDFKAVVSILTSEFQVEQFPICDVLRSRDTGEFFYSNEHDEWQPETFLMDTKVAADRERTRIMKLIKRWTEK